MPVYLLIITCMKLVTTSLNHLINSQDIIRGGKGISLLCNRLVPQDFRPDCSRVELTIELC